MIHLICLWRFKAWVGNSGVMLQMSRKHNPLLVMSIKKCGLSEWVPHLHIFRNTVALDCQPPRRVTLSQTPQSTAAQCTQISTRPHTTLPVPLDCEVERYTKRQFGVTEKTVTCIRRGWEHSQIKLWSYFIKIIKCYRFVIQEILPRLNVVLLLFHSLGSLQLLVISWEICNL